jgi:hypothetical protein
MIAITTFGGADSDGVLCRRHCCKRQQRLPGPPHRRPAAAPSLPSKRWRPLPPPPVMDGWGSSRRDSESDSGDRLGCQSAAAGLGSTAAGAASRPSARLGPRKTLPRTTLWTFSRSAQQADSAQDSAGVPQAAPRTRPARSPWVRTPRSRSEPEAGDEAPLPLAATMAAGGRTAARGCRDALPPARCALCTAAAALLRPCRRRLAGRRPVWPPPRRRPGHSRRPAAIVSIPVPPTSNSPRRHRRRRRPAALRRQMLIMRVRDISGILGGGLTLRPPETLPRSTRPMRLGGGDKAAQPKRCRHTKREWKLKVLGGEIEVKARRQVRCPR